MHSNKKVGDTVYLVGADKISKPCEEEITRIGRVYLLTVTGKEFRVDNGTERSRSRRGGLMAMTRAWPSKDYYDATFNHHVQFSLFQRVVARMKASAVTPQQLAEACRALNTTKE